VITYCLSREREKVNTSSIFVPIHITVLILPIPKMMEVLLVENNNHTTSMGMNPNAALLSSSLPSSRRRINRSSSEDMLTISSSINSLSSTLPSVSDLEGSRTVMMRRGSSLLDLKDSNNNGKSNAKFVDGLLLLKNISSWSRNNSTTSFESLSANNNGSSPGAGSVRSSTSSRRSMMSDALKQSLRKELIETQNELNETKQQIKIAIGKASSCRNLM